MKTVIYWFRSDLRLSDNPAFALACTEADYLLPIYIHPTNLEEKTLWGFPRVTKHRKVFLKESLQDLRAQLREMGSELLEISGNVLEVFQGLRLQLDANWVYCEQIEAPEELEQVALLIDAGFNLKLIWQSSMLDPQSLPFKLEDMPDIFTQFRQQIEKHQFRFASPIDAPTRIPPLPESSQVFGQVASVDVSFADTLFSGGEGKALLHTKQYFDRRLPNTYKQTRNQLIGMDYSSKFSPWLALGCISARSIAKKLTDYEMVHGANDGTYWLWFELLWRDYFRFLHFKYGNQLYRSGGLSAEPSNPLIETKLKQWISGNTGQPLVDAGMHELQTTGYLSNRMRQIVASYWIYNMKGDWQASAAWFESQLIDYDVYSNQGNWLYIAGKGTDPRGGRPMNLAKQTQDHDPDGAYRKIWLS
jgi:deoxyribodipyrimidine photo-lyase